MQSTVSGEVGWRAACAAGPSPARAPGAGRARPGLPLRVAAPAKGPPGPGDISGCPLPGAESVRPAHRLPDQRDGRAGPAALPPAPERRHAPEGQARGLPPGQQGPAPAPCHHGGRHARRGLLSPRPPPGPGRASGSRPPQNGLALKLCWDGAVGCTKRQCVCTMRKRW